MAHTVPPSPVAVCMVCGSYARSADRINEPCGKTIDGKKCNGAFGSAVGALDWKVCCDCLGEGCEVCQSTGWRYVRGQRPNLKPNMERIPNG